MEDTVSIFISGFTVVVCLCWEPVRNGLLSLIKEILNIV